MQNFTDYRNELLRRGRDFLHARKAYLSEPDCLPSMIMACIEAGHDTRDAIIRTVPKLGGRSYREVAWTVDRLSGTSPEEHYWYCDQTQTYHLHLPAAKAKKGKRKPLASAVAVEF